MVNFGAEKDLVSRLAHALEEKDARPLAFLTGAGLSVPAVPGVTETLTILRKSFSKDELYEFDELLSPHVEPGEKYRQAFQFLGLRRPPKAAERVLKVATLRAYDSGDTDINQLLDQAGVLEGNLENWKLPNGQASLGRILAGLPPRLRGPIFTTNFDPLTEIAIRRAGGVVTPHIHVDDSSFIANLRVQSGSSVIHLHGYWRDSQVLNTTDQLLQDRPSLAASLRVILENHTLVVLGYGGWSDVISRSLLDAIRQQRSGDLDVLWCLHKSAHELERSLGSDDAVQGFADAPGNVQFYAGIDANTVLPALEKRIAGVLEYEDAPPPKSNGLSLLGWDTITRRGLAEMSRNATEAAALSFFDGRLPAWHDAISKHIPVRTLAIEISEKVLSAQNEGSSSLSVITGPSGEGKSTVALQVGTILARSKSPEFRVFVLNGDFFGSLNAIRQLPLDVPYLLLIDEAHRFVGQLQELVAIMQSTGRRGIHVLLVSGDSDWLASGGANFAWSRFMPTSTYSLQGLTHVDASSLVGAWENIGSAALGDLSRFVSTDERVNALLDYSHGIGVAGPGTLLGALLTARYDRNGLREHIRGLLNRLRTRLIPGGDSSSLLDAVVAIAVPHAYGVDALNASVMADAFGLNNVELTVYVLLPLGEEAAITYNSGHIVMRHELIASAVIDLCLEMGVDLAGATRRVVRSAVRRMNRTGYDTGLATLAYLASRMSDIPKLALGAADAAVEAAPARLSYRTTRSKVLRTAHRARDAAAENEAALHLIFDPENVGQTRGFFVEWGVVEGLLGNFARNAVLAGAALQDGVGLGRLDLEQTERGLSCLLLALRRLSETDSDPDLVSGLAAASVFARSIEPKSTAGRDWLRSAERVVDRRGHTYPSLNGTDEAARGLRAGLDHALSKLETRFPKEFPRTDFQFGSLLELAVSRSFSY